MACVLAAPRGLHVGKKFESPQRSPPGGSSLGQLVKGARVVIIENRDRRGRPISWDQFVERWLDDGYKDVAEDAIQTPEGEVTVFTSWTGMTAALGQDHEGAEEVRLYETTIIGGQQRGRVVGNSSLIGALRQHDRVVASVRAEHGEPEGG